jgi:hypothetical protein
MGLHFGEPIAPALPQKKARQAATSGSKQHVSWFYAVIALRAVDSSHCNVVLARKVASSRSGTAVPKSRLQRRIASAAGRPSPLASRRPGSAARYSLGRPPLRSSGRDRIEDARRGRSVHLSVRAWRLALVVPAKVAVSPTKCL